MAGCIAHATDELKRTYCPQAWHTQHCMASPIVDARQRGRHCAPYAKGAVHCNETETYGLMQERKQHTGQKSVLASIHDQHEPNMQQRLGCWTQMSSSDLQR